MIRAVLALALTAALLGVSLPTVDDARRDHSNAVVRTEVDRFERMAGGLLEADDPTNDEEGARRVVALGIPGESWADAGVERLRIEPRRNATGARFVWSLVGGTRSVRELPGLPLQTRDGDALVVGSPGRHRLVLALRGTPRDPVVSVRRFTTEEVTTGDHVRTVSDASGRDHRRLRV